MYDLRREDAGEFKELAKTARASLDLHGACLVQWPQQLPLHPTFHVGYRPFGLAPAADDAFSFLWVPFPYVSFFPRVSTVKSLIVIPHHFVAVAKPHSLIPYSPPVPQAVLV